MTSPSSPTPPPSPFRPSKPLPLKPRRVRGGVKLNLPEGDVPWAAERGSNWAAQRWVRLLEQAASGKDLLEGLEYARQGQTKSISVETGAIVASVQGRADRPYATRLKIQSYSAEQWEIVVKAMTDQAVYAAKLLSGELPPSIEDVFGPLDLKLFPVQVSEIACHCTCSDFRASEEVVRAKLDPSQSAKPAAAPAMPPAEPTASEFTGPPTAADAARSLSAQALSTQTGGGHAMPGMPSSQSLSMQPFQRSFAPPPMLPPLPIGVHVPWCKHAACVTYLFAHRLMSDPFLMFKLRGLDGHEMIDRLRHSRAIATSSRTSPSVYAARVPGVSDAAPVPLADAMANFWEIGPGFEEFEAPLERPPVSHPLLRRLGPSPLAGEPSAGAGAGSVFPLVGLLASCYETISEQTLRGGETAGTDDAPPAEE